MSIKNMLLLVECESNSKFIIVVSLYIDIINITKKFIIKIIV